jgi:hypothetical protein
VFIISVEIINNPVFAFYKVCAAAERQDWCVVIGYQYAALGKGLAMVDKDN